MRRWCRKVKNVKVGFLYSATYTVNHRDQPHFTILEVAVDWQEPMVLQRKLRPSIACVNVQLDRQHVASKHATAPINHTRPSPRKLSPDGATRARKHIRLQLTTQFIDLERMNGWVDLSGWLVVTYRNKVPSPGVEPGHVTHPSTNRAQHISLIRPTLLPLHMFSAMGHLINRCCNLTSLTWWSCATT